MAYHGRLKVDLGVPCRRVAVVVARCVFRWIVLLGRDILTDAHLLLVLCHVCDPAFAYFRQAHGRVGIHDQSLVSHWLD